MTSTQPTMPSSGDAWGADGSDPMTVPVAADEWAAPSETPEDWLAERFADEFGATDGRPQTGIPVDFAPVWNDLPVPAAADPEADTVLETVPEIVSESALDVPTVPETPRLPLDLLIADAVPAVPDDGGFVDGPDPFASSSDVLAPGLMLMTDPMPAVVPPAAPVQLPPTDSDLLSALAAPIPAETTAWPIPAAATVDPTPADVEPALSLESEAAPVEQRPAVVALGGASSVTSGMVPGLRPSDIVESVTQTVQGMRATIELVTIAFLAEGHILIEDVPGVGKTTLAKALAAAISADAGRIQFTPDVLPSDILGVNIYRAERHDFDFIPGPIFANIVIADEINRASPKTQSALLEAMQEGQVTVEGATHQLSHPFIVLATQNPIEMDGTYPLPEAQRDRFMMRVAMGYPDPDHEVAMLEAQEFTDALSGVHPVATLDQVRALISSIRGLYAAPAIKKYIVALAEATRNDPELALGVSPRACLQLLRAAKAAAALDGRDFVLPDDVQHLAGHVWGHRLVHRRAGAGQLNGLEYMRRLVARVKVS